MVKLSSVSALSIALLAALNDTTSWAFVPSEALNKLNSVIAPSSSSKSHVGKLFAASVKEEQETETEIKAITTTDNDDVITTTKTKKSWDDDGFVFGLEGSGLERPKGKEVQIVVDGDTLETQPYQVAIVQITFLAHAYFAISSFYGMLEHNNNDVTITTIQTILITLSSWILADFGSGVLHWSVDNYGNGKTPIMGSIIAAFQGHHSAPWTITQRGFCNNVYKLCIPFGILPMTIINTITNPSITLFFTTFCVLEILSQEFHKWSHQLQSETPKFANTLQNLGLTIARKPHAQHHIAPYEGNYCIISGVCNKYLDESGFFRKVERIVYNINGIEPNSWKLDPLLKEKTLNGDYTIPTTTTIGKK